MIYDTKVQRWEYGKPIVESGGIVSRWLLGPCPKCGTITSTYGGGFSCHNDHCRNSCFTFAVSSEPKPVWWGNGVQVYKDGDSWCAVNADFINIQESHIGFGDTPDEAVKDLNK